MSNWHQRFLEVAEIISTWSKDPSTKVGAVIVDRKRRVVSHGYNGFPRGVRDDASRYADRETKMEMVVHAEANAILNAKGADLEGTTLYCTFFPCPHCAALIIQAGISTVIATPREADGRYEPRFQISRQMFREAGIVFHEGRNV